MTRSAQEIRSLILETYAKLKRDHFEVMGLERTATEAEVGEAYRGFARILHPDACQGLDLEDLREKREAVFIRVSAAYEALRDPASRAEYERAFEPSKLRSPKARPVTGETPGPAAPPPEPAAPLPARPSPPPTPAVPNEPTPTLDARLTPERILATAEAFFEKERYWEAIQQLEPMVLRAEEPTRARAKMLLARAYMKNPKWMKQAEGVLQSLLDESPRDIAVCLVLAQLYRDVNLPARAKALYRKVLDIQPGNAAALDALAAFDQEAHVAPAPSRFAGLFKGR